ncbi:MAG TPA: hypothetical protein VII43_10630 [Opitutaceae bacterium]
MNSKSLSYLSVLAVIAASVVLPVSAVTVAITFSVAGVLAILSADYGHEIKPLDIPASPIPFRLPAADLREAA